MTAPPVPKKHVRISLADDGGETVVVSPGDDSAEHPPESDRPTLRPGELDPASKQAFEKLGERLSNVSLAPDIQALRNATNDQFSTPFGAPSHIVKLLSDTEASVGNRRVNLDSEFFEYMTPEQRGKLRKEYNQKLGVPDGFDDTYFNPYIKDAKTAYAFEEPSDFMKHDTNRRLNDLLGSGRGGAPAKVRAVVLGLRALDRAHLSQRHELPRR